MTIGEKTIMGIILMSALGFGIFMAWAEADRRGAFVRRSSGISLFGGGSYNARKAPSGTFYDAVWVQTGPGSYLHCEAAGDVLRCSERRVAE